MASRFKRRMLCTCANNEYHAVIYYSNWFILLFKMAWNCLRHPKTTSYYVKRKG